MVKRLFRLILNHINGDKLIIHKGVRGITSSDIWCRIDIVRSNKEDLSHWCIFQILDKCIEENKERWKIERVEYEN